ncbi:IS4 family transposase [Deinococcus peraridilitoris]|uniref:Transposase family protein n=1 Tax=Deinococcus peraridilitoris (strain DSM 19664 / LMG 22246 / CIP 109416 / KR-200) TaxID=937777 RepID=L0A687_DEIPD|nr:IS4 family transposase [Deinococcus peraridilitoris]AFZ66657.1 transposase family protein [Deinococcus peraridilitoris DSM 19664]AFZ67230.1 transposase family protein [Deinococcus peraridilitoris DSM 19664]AFZ67649.1 transposase family protein [Deinococcus peraridilitoris DSM 19664]AFZ67781.1 transposase family protein [Deinococcus peraridilitoris DSM 19664]AFZ68515.1 transposase family protein [Deinococcus peraridilitoris DSM 19664]
MSLQEAALADPTKLGEVIKHHLPFLRRDTLQRLADVVTALIQARSTKHAQLALHLPGTVGAVSKLRRVERCLHDPQLDRDVFLKLLVPLLPDEKLVMTMDRTNWEHGEADLNLLVLGVVLEGFTLPLVWMALPHGGSSDTGVRERLVAQLLKVLPAKRWRVLVADREFVGAAWFTFLRRRGIKRCLRIRGDARIDDVRLDEGWGYVQPGQVVALLEKANVYGNVMQLVVTRTDAGELLALATDLKIDETRAVYRLRWTVECTFSTQKSRGFDLEASAMTRPDRLERLFGVVTLALAWCLRVGVWCHQQRPIKRKKHGRRAVSLVRYGLELLSASLRWDTSDCLTLLALVMQPFPAPAHHSIQVVGY